MYLPDRRGSGTSSEPRGFFESREQLIDDVRRFVELASRESDAPVVVVGGCWGARPAVGYALEAQDGLAGLALVCPALKVKVDLTLGEKLKVLGGGVARPRLPVRIPLEPELFTRNPPYLEFIRTDPLALHEVAASFFLKQALWDRRLLRATGLRLPLLLLQSGRDEIVDVDGVQAWFERQEASDKRLVVYPEFDHLLDFEPDRGRYLDDLAGWLDERTARSGASERERAPA
jgi:alpha-beta hydrolase superfamily lysophospholipase